MSAPLPLFKRTHHRINMTHGDRIFGVLNTLLLITILLLVIYPLWYVVISSASDPREVVMGNAVIWFKGFTLDAYKMLFRYEKIGVGYQNTIFYTFFGTLLSLVATTTTAYPLASRQLYGRNLITKLFTFTMFFQGGIIPTYFIVRDLGLYDSRLVILLLPAISMWNVIIMRTFFQDIPLELQEAAQIDGCSHFQTLIRVVLPLSKPIIAVMIIFYGVAHWNSYFNALIYLSDSKKYPLQLVLRELLVMSQMQEIMMDAGEMSSREGVTMSSGSIKYALMMISSLPVLMLYPLLQKHFTKGVMVGAVKG